MPFLRLSSAYAASLSEFQGLLWTQAEEIAILADPGRTYDDDDPSKVLQYSASMTGNDTSPTNAESLSHFNSVDISTAYVHVPINNDQFEDSYSNLHDSDTDNGEDLSLEFWDEDSDSDNDSFIDVPPQAPHVLPHGRPPIRPPPRHRIAPRIFRIAPAPMDDMGDVDDDSDNSSVPSLMSAHVLDDSDSSSSWDEDYFGDNMMSSTKLMTISTRHCTTPQLFLLWKT